MNYTKTINENQIMSPVPIKNKYVLDALNNFLWFWKNPTFLDNVKTVCEKETFEKWTSEEHLHEIMAQGNTHEGFPEVCKSKSLAPNRLVEAIGHDRMAIAECIEKFIQYNTELSQVLAVRNNALGVMYPPGGFISWHNNHNAPGYNLIFSYAETNTGYFEYYDSATEQIVKLYDTAGEWTCKAGYFASKEEPIEKKVYHSASAPDDYRMTISYIFNRSEMGNGLHDETIEEIMTEI